MLLCFCCCDYNKIKMPRKPGKKKKENPVGCTRKVKDEREVREGYGKIRREPPVVEFGG